MVEGVPDHTGDVGEALAVLVDEAEAEPVVPDSRTGEDEPWCDGGTVIVIQEWPSVGSPVEEFSRRTEPGAEPGGCDGALRGPQALPVLKVDDVPGVRVPGHRLRRRPDECQPPGGPGFPQSHGGAGGEA